MPRERGKGGWTDYEVGLERKLRALAQKVHRKRSRQRVQRSFCNVLWSVHHSFYEIPQKIDTELPYSLKYGVSGGQIVHQKCSALFLCFFLAVRDTRFRFVSLFAL